MIYKCIKQYNDIEVGSFWKAKSNHYMFYEMSGRNRARYLTPFILEKYFEEVKNL